MERHKSILYRVFLLLLPLVLLCACPMAQAQTPCGMPQPISSSQDTIVVPSNYITLYTPAPNYNTVTFPVGLPGYQDTDFSTTNPCTIIRVTQGDHAPVSDPNEVAPVSFIHAYKYTPISCTDDVELVGAGSINSWTLMHIPAGTWWKDIPNNNTTGITHDNTVNPLWEHCTHGQNTISGRTIYWHALNGPQLYRYRADLGTDTLLHDFSLAGNTVCGGTCTKIYFGGSSNGPHQGIDSPDDVVAITALGSNGYWYVFEWDLFNNVQVTQFVPHQFPSGVSYPIAAAYPDHRLMTSANDTNGDGFSGADFYDASGKFLVHINGATDQHNEEAIDSTGADVVYAGSPNQAPFINICPHQAGILKFQLDPPYAITCVAEVGWDSMHISVTQDGQWIEVDDELSHNDPTLCTNAYLNANPSINWASYIAPQGTNQVVTQLPDEIVLAKTDGSIVYRMTHHRSRLRDNATCTGGITSLSSYWAQPKAAISYSGKYIAFTSNMGIGITTTGGQGSYTDEYLVATGLGGSTSGSLPNPPTNLAATVQ